jgi:hypothetical protein
MGRTAAGWSPVPDGNSVTRLVKSNARRLLPIARMNRFDLSSLAITPRFSSVMGTTFGVLGKAGLGMAQHTLMLAGESQSQKRTLIVAGLLGEATSG